MDEKIIILDCGSQYTQLIARRIRELHIFCEIYPYYKFPEKREIIKGIIISGSPFSVTDKNAPTLNFQNFGNIPLLGICYAAQYFCHKTGGKVTSHYKREYGKATLININSGSKLFKNIPEDSPVWMSHGDTIEALPKKVELLASTSSVQNAAFYAKGNNMYGLQFHPEVYHTQHGENLLYNFAVDICGCKQSYTPSSFIKNSLIDIRQKLGNERVILGISGGVDSTVSAVLLHKAIKKNLSCIFIDNGLLRKNEFENTLVHYKNIDLNVIGIDSKDLFLQKLKGVKDPEKKRKVIGNTFIRVFEKEAKRLKNVRWLAQGTIYPDVIESISVVGPSHTIKSHHNVGGLPRAMKLKVIEPLKMLFKDEVRQIGLELGVPRSFLYNHPFPGPGLAVRILGEVTKEKVNLLQEVDDIYIELLRKHRLYDNIWQAGAILLPIRSVGVMGDKRSYEYVVALRAVTSTDGMTANWVYFSQEVFTELSNQIINQVKGVNRVVYDISSKPPTTIEWE